MVLPVTHALGAHGASVGPADVLLGLGEPHQNLRSNGPDLRGRAGARLDRAKQTLD